MYKSKLMFLLLLFQARESCRLIRLWATPDLPGKDRDAIWTELVDAGVDLINTDDLDGLRVFLLFFAYR